MDPVDRDSRAFPVLELFSLLGFVLLCWSLVGAEDASGPSGDTEQNRDLGDALSLSLSLSRAFTDAFTTCNTRGVIAPSPPAPPASLPLPPPSPSGVLRTRLLSPAAA